ncbi:hypothetical protein [Bordetella genomosp. 9]|uniref:Uncharacterized protein n=1 Tax=Bordetella genomosp. 9 TaxID=1416803 RepID=A0A1W6YUN5_9BORD|nr:hypothetical protein [Bordetella genomosp. 9]ARP84797.1 hypothetical protein CAL13_00065 [Bordetella genomosp. 9]
MAPQQGSNPIPQHTDDLLKEDRSNTPRDVPPRDEYNPSDGRSGTRDSDDLEQNIGREEPEDDGQG